MDSSVGVYTPWDDDMKAAGAPLPSGATAAAASHAREAVAQVFKRVVLHPQGGEVQNKQLVAFASVALELRLDRLVNGQYQPVGVGE